MADKNQLVNSNQEAFAQLVANGSDYTSAYKEVYGTHNTGSASRLRHTPHVSRRIEALMCKQVMDAKLTGGRVIEELAALGLANMADIIEIQEDGSAVVDLRALTREQAAAISEIESLTITDPVTGAKKVKTKVKLYDKKGPLDSLAKHFGMLIEKHEHGAPGDFSRADSVEDIANKIKAELGEEDAKRFLTLFEESKKEQGPDSKTIQTLPAPRGSGTLH